MSKVTKNFIAITLLSALVLSSSLFWAGLSAEFGVTSTDTSGFNKSSEITPLLEEFKAQSEDVVETDVGGVFRVVANVVNTVKTLLASLNIFLVYITELANVIKVPLYIITFIITIITIKTLVSFINVARGGEKA